MSRPEAERALHDLCQPLMVLQCRLELAQMSGDVANMREAVSGGVEDVGRIVMHVRQLRAALQTDGAGAGERP